MSFISSIFKRTENDAIGYVNASNPLVDFFYRLPSYRQNKASALNDFMAAYHRNPEYALKLLFMVRDIEKGSGERELFRYIIKNTSFPAHLVSYIPQFGRFDDLRVLLDTERKEEVMHLISSQLSEDEKAFANQKPISLLAKWLPSENTSSKQTKQYATIIRKALGCSPKEYRQLLAKLRKYLNVIEVKTSGKQWDEIDYNTVPSLANLKYKEAFLRHDEQRRTQWLEKLKKNLEKPESERDKTIKVNTKTTSPYDIVRQYMNLFESYEEEEIKANELLESMWKSLPREGLNEETLVVMDTSGSMRGQPRNMAAALSIFFAQQIQGEYNGKAILFSEHPEWLNLQGEKLVDNLKYLNEYNECSNTNIEATFHLILDTAVNANLRADELPKTLLIISDMEFDSATINYNNPQEVVPMEKIRQSFAKQGYLLPKLVFWNVSARTNTVPMTMNEQGVILLSGNSVHNTDMILSGKLDPWEALKEKLESERYKGILLK